MDFERAWPLLQSAAVLGDSLSKEEAIEGLRNGTFALFTREHAAALSANMGNFLRVGLAGGDLSELIDIEAEIFEYAEQNGYQAVEIVGRPGWERVLEGYEKIAVILRKPV